jgi:tetratricopeptide (TPR) repeat protein
MNAGGWLVISMAFVSGCATQTATLQQHLPPKIAPTVELEQTPFFPDETASMRPRSTGHRPQRSRLCHRTGPAEFKRFLPTRQGSLQTEMLASSRSQGAVATRLAPNLAALVQEVSINHPVVVLQNLGLNWAPKWHYAVVVGYHLPDQTIVLRSGPVKRQVLSMRTFEHTWARSGFWAFVVTSPGQWPTTAQEADAVEAAVGFERSALPSQAKAVYASALMRWPNNLTLAMGLGNTHFALGNKTQAAQIFEAAAKKHQSTPAWINLTLTLLELDRQTDALQAAQTAMTLADPHWQAQAQDALHQAQK